MQWMRYHVQLHYIMGDLRFIKDKHMVSFVPNMVADMDINSFKWLHFPVI